MGLVHVVFEQPALRIVLATVVTFHKVFGRMHISYVVLEFLEGLAAMRTRFLHVEVDCPVMGRAVTSLSEPLHTNYKVIPTDSEHFTWSHWGQWKRDDSGLNTGCQEGTATVRAMA